MNRVIMPDNYHHYQNFFNWQIKHRWNVISKKEKSWQMFTIETMACLLFYVIFCKADWPGNNWSASWRENLSSMSDIRLDRCTQKEQWESSNQDNEDCQRNPRWSFQFKLWHHCWLWSCCRSDWYNCSWLPVLQSRWEPLDNPPASYICCQCWINSLLPTIHHPLPS